MVQSRHPGEEIEIEIERDDVKQRLEIIVGRRAE
jgi:hypothetical protein